MSVQPTTVCSALGSPSRPYAQISLVELIERIVEASDAAAVRELHDHRMPFRIGGQQRRLTLTAFVAALCEMPWMRRLCGHDQLIIDRAYDLTIDRFSSLPRESGDPWRAPSNSPDCRHYFGSVLEAVRNLASAHGPVHGLKQEAAASRILQQRVLNHAWLACREACRSRNVTRSRYAWKLNGCALYIWMPATIAGHRRRNWLEENIPDANPMRPGEAIRVQSIVDEYFGIQHVFSLSGDPPIDVPCGDQNPAPSSWDKNERLPFDLAAVIADEKAGRIDQLRPAIRALGPERLRSLIVQVFALLKDDSFQQNEIAKAFHITPPSLSRFAGKDWDDVGHVPDLWVNCAHVLSENEDYIEAAIAAGVWDMVQAIIEKDGKRGQRGAQP